MGQYLTIGIATRIVADKERAERLFAFFTRLLRTQLASYCLANSLLVYISG